MWILRVILDDKCTRHIRGYSLVVRILGFAEEPFDLLEQVEQFDRLRHVVLCDILNRVFHRIEIDDASEEQNGSSFFLLDGALSILPPRGRA